MRPGTSCPRDPQHRFDKAPVITAAAARVRRFAQTMRLHLRPLGVGQYESFHPKLESQPAIRWNPESQQALVDDVLTSGATVEGCAKALLRAGARNVDVMVFARVAEGGRTSI